MTGNNNIPVNKELSDELLEQIKLKHDQGRAFKNKSSHQNLWESGIEVISSCGKMKNSKYHIEFSLISYQKIGKLKSYYPNLEWLAYLSGNIDHKKRKVFINDIIIPDSQQVTASSVYNVEYKWDTLSDKYIIGVIHSHHKMGAFFSGTDDAYINQNHDVSIVVSTAKGKEIKAQVRVKIPCGSYIITEDVTFSVKDPQMIDEVQFESEFKDKIHTYQLPVMNNNRQVVESDYFDEDFDDPYLMSELDLRDKLLDYYSEDDIDEFMSQGKTVAAQELEDVQELMRDHDVNSEWSLEDELFDLDEQNGLHQTQYGVPLNSETENGWEIEDEDGVMVKEVIHTPTGVVVN